MSIHGTKKQEVIGRFERHNKDTGSPEVQIALITSNIAELTRHFDAHKKDFGSRTGLLRMVSRRRSLLDYLRKTNREKYGQLITSLGIRK